MGSCLANFMLCPLASGVTRPVESRPGPAWKGFGSLRWFRAWVQPGAHILLCTSLFAVLRGSCKAKRSRWLRPLSGLEVHLLCVALWLFPRGGAVPSTEPVLGYQGASQWSRYWCQVPVWWVGR